MRVKQYIAYKIENNLMEVLDLAKTVDLKKHKEKYLQFIESRKTLILSMLDAKGNPFTSCAPFVKKDGKLYIYISEVAEHYHLLEKNEYIDALLIADEADSKNAFATERARLQSVPKNIGNEGHDDIFELFYETHGKPMVEMLQGLDFSLFELTPSQGRYVVGFGLAFEVDIEGEKFIHVVVDKENKSGVTKNK